MVSLINIEDMIQYDSTAHSQDMQAIEERLRQIEQNQLDLQKALGQSPLQCLRQANRNNRPECQKYDELATYNPASG